MTFFKKLFNSGDLVKEVGDVVDNLTTTNEEKLEAMKKQCKLRLVKGGGLTCKVIHG